MANVTQTTTTDWQLFDAGGSATHLIYAGVGGSINYDDAVLARTEHADVAAAVSDITTRALTVSPVAMQGVPATDDNGDPNPDFATLYQGLGIPLLEVDFSGETAGAVSTIEFFGSGMTGAAVDQPNGVQTTLQSNQQSLAFTGMYVMRPDTNVQAETTLEVSLAENAATSVTIEYEIGSAGVLEDDDVLIVELDDDNGAVELATYAGNIALTTYSVTHTIAGDPTVRFRSLLGEGPVEAHVINYIRIK